MNILCIGNSFAEDVSTYVHKIAEAAHEDLNIYVLYIGGCPISRHLKNIRTGDKEYFFMENGGEKIVTWVDIFYGLKFVKYDYITFQQVSQDSWNVDTYFPYLIELMEEVRKYSDAKFVIHQTWSYGKYYQHYKYGQNPLDQEAMTKDVRNAYLEAAKRVNIPYIIPSGEAIKNARKVFGDELNRDGFHLNERGRTLTGYLLAFYFLGDKIDVSSFRPSGHTYNEAGDPPVDEKELPTLVEIAKETLKENKGLNLK